MSLLRKILYPLSLIYALVVHLRNYLFDASILGSKSFETPTVCIGNLSVGGTGKTPMAEFLISILRQKYTIALLSRGYRRTSKGFVLADKKSGVGDLGDEPYQIHLKFPDVAVAVDADRQNGIRRLQKEVSPEIILLDDAFQHRKVTYGFSILLTAYGNLYCDDLYLPTGSLRDSKREAKRADLIIVTKCPQNLTAAEQTHIIDRIRPMPDQKVLFSYLSYSSNFSGKKGSFGLDYFMNKKVTLVTGIANPAPLVAYLHEAGLTFEHLRFKDHHRFSENELQRLLGKQCIITTEKDYVRLGEGVENAFYLSIEHRFLNNGQEVLEGHLAQFMKANS